MADRLDDRGLATVFGGSGFVGRYAVAALAKQGWRVRAAVRRPDLAGFLQPAGFVGQVAPVQANVRYPQSVERAVAGDPLFRRSSTYHCAAHLAQRACDHSLGAR